MGRNFDVFPGCQKIPWMLGFLEKKEISIETAKVLLLSSQKKGSARCFEVVLRLYSSWCGERLLLVGKAFKLTGPPERIGTWGLVPTNFVRYSIPIPIRMGKDYAHRIGLSPPRCLAFRWP